jgi:Skp family chaperone for outer membrane proteins
MQRVLYTASALLVVFACQAFAQTSPTRIGVINSSEFANEKTGITRYVSTLKSLNAEFAPTQNELRTMNTRLQTISKDMETARKAPNPQSTVINAKIQEGEKLTRDMKFKAEDAKARYQTREQALLGPVTQDIYKALQEFSKQKGYSLIFDVAKDSTGMLAALGDEKVLVTKDFIAFYNAKTAGVPLPK